ncbi:MAG: hypothetical protein AB1586_18300 [Pseudomonadota bacterium]|jgi:hypothetical protein
MMRAFIERGLAWLAVAVVAVVAGFLVLRLYGVHLRTPPEPQQPIRIFRSPTNNDFS